MPDNESPKLLSNEIMFVFPPPKRRSSPFVGLSQSLAARPPCISAVGFLILLGPPDRTRRRLLFYTYILFYTFMQHPDF